MELDVERENVLLLAATGQAEAMDIGDSHFEDTLLRYYSSFRQGPANVARTGDLLAQLVHNVETIPKLNSQLQSEFSYYIDALLDNPKVDALYLHILAHLTDTDLRDLIIRLLVQCRGQRQTRECSAILFSFLRMMAAPTSDELIIQQIRETCHSLFNEAKLKSSNYCNAYRHTALMKFLPVILAQRNFSPSSREFLFGVIPELVKFFLSAVFEWNSEQLTSVVVPIDSAWVSLFQTVRRILDVCCEDNKIPKSPEFWSVWKTSVPCLKVWWKQLIQWNTIVRQSTNFPSTILFWLKFIFAGFLIYIYDQIKLECGLPERRPFLFEIPNIYGASKTSSRQSTSHIDRTVSRLQQIFLLAENVWTTLIREQQMYPDSIMDTTIAELALHDSPMFLSFQSDFWTFHQLPGFIPPHEIHPSWLTIQLLSRNVSLKLSTGQLTPSILEEVLNLTAKFQLRNGWSRTTSKDFDEERGLRYICDDSEILVFFCSVCTVHMARQPVERCSDEFLSTLLVFMQPVIDKCTDLLRAVAAALIMRQKFVFRQFFTYICSPEIIAEISGLLGKVGLELTPEPLTSTAGSVHNTRGAIRGSTDVLQTELQKLAINAISNSDVILAVQRYMGDNAETLSVVMFQQQQQPAISPPRRGRSGNIIS